MDNLRSLSGSLPAPTSSRRNRPLNSQQQHPPAQLIQAFKTAAMSVTNLYRTAASDISSAYTDGHRDALEDLVSFLDKENLGLNGGEGWRVRQWAAERMAGQAQQPSSDGSEDEEGLDGEDAEKRARSSSPTLQQKTSNEQPPNPTVDAVRSVSPPRSGSAPPVQVHQTTTQPNQFTFQSGFQYPATQGQDVEMAGGSNGGGQGLPITARSTRSSRHGHSLRSNHNLHNRTTVNLGSGAGAKRKLPFIDFFDVSGLNANGNARDGQSGGGGHGLAKRNRQA
ncbi:hypothetical protein NA57DRAFT_75259 [Rhizodiscina lignyota]|uniref:Uncharacterized protein n=1 Tax=Rhizodiscina lignyota TaxID=1504668 RepID=A0A9P4II89_9PEZI|nr:hypothetical protein NA57DRAFT_75259 [Rhizodiscina lignyota]